MKVESAPRQEPLAPANLSPPFCIGFILKGMVYKKLIKKQRKWQFIIDMKKDLRTSNILLKEKTCVNMGEKNFIVDVKKRINNYG